MQAGTGIRFSKNNIKTNHGRLILLSQAAHQFSHDIAPPGPTSDFAQALFVNVDNDDALIERFRHRQAQASIVKVGFQRRHEGNLPDLPGVAKHQYNAQCPKEEAGKMLFHNQFTEPERINPI